MPAPFPPDQSVITLANVRNHITEPYFIALLSSQQYASVYEDIRNKLCKT